MRARTLVLAAALAFPVGAYAQVSGSPQVTCPNGAGGTCVPSQDGGALPTGVTQMAGGSGLTGLMGAIYAKLLGSLAVTGTFWQATQPVSDQATVALNNKLAASGNGTDSTVTAPAALTQLASFTVTNPGAYRIQNQSAGTIQYQLCATGGTGCTTFLLAPGAGANAQGADSSPEVAWFTGVINILGATGAQFAARHN